jgi:hypothetical protein
MKDAALSNYNTSLETKEKKMSKSYADILLCSIGSSPNLRNCTKQEI